MASGFRTSKPGRQAVAIVDGYNVIMQHPQWRAIPVNQARRQLIAGLQRLRWPMLVETVEVVFDGSPGYPGEWLGGQGVRASFAGDADASIRRMIQESEAPERLIVVSDDREIVDTAKSHGSRGHGVRWLFERLASEAKAAQADRPSPGPLTPTQISAINAELRRRWKLPPA